MEDVSSALLMEDYSGDDVPQAIIIDGKSRPIGTYLRRRLRTRMGRDVKAPQATLDKMAEELQPLREKAFAYAPLNSKTFAFKQEVISAGEGKRRRQKFWLNVANQKRKVL